MPAAPLPGECPWSRVPRAPHTALGAGGDEDGDRDGSATGGKMGPRPCEDAGGHC